MKKENSLNVAQQGGSLISLSLWLCIVPFSRQQGHFIHDFYGVTKCHAWSQHACFYREWLACLCSAKSQSPTHFGEAAQISRTENSNPT